MAQKINIHDINEILNQHSLWLRTEGNEGRRAVLHDIIAKDLDLNKANLRRADLSMSDFSGANFTDADLREANLYQAILNSAVLKRAKLGDANLTETKLNNADLSAAKFNHSDLTRSDLSNAKLHKAIIKSSILSEAKLEGTTLSNAEIISSDLNNAELGNTNLVGAIIKDATLDGATLIESDLSGSLVINPTLIKAKIVNPIIDGAVISTLETAQTQLDFDDITPALYSSNQLPHLYGILDIREFHKVQRDFIAGNIGKEWQREKIEHMDEAPKGAATYKSSDSIALESDGEELYSVNVLYGTNRKPNNNTLPHDPFSNERSEIMHYGSIDVVIPSNHEIGNIEQPGKFSWFKILFKSDTESEYFNIKNHTMYANDQEFLNELSNNIDNTLEKSAFVFIHGYNVTFRDAVLRAAQFSHDLKLKIEPIIFSWPSRGNKLIGKLGVNAYIEDEESAAWSVHYLEEFLEKISMKMGDRTIHVIAHSMGNRILSQALEHIHLKNGRKNKTKFKQIVLAAPDIGADTFQNMSDAISNQGEKVTIYASSKDTALKFSSRLHDFKRLGDTKGKIHIFNNIDTVDATNMDTTPMFRFGEHSYFAKLRPLIRDLYDLLVESKQPDDRFELNPSYDATNKYWIFRR